MKKAVKIEFHSQTERAILIKGPFGVFLEYLGEEHAWWMRPAFPFIIAVHVIESFVAMVIAGYLALTV